MSLATHLDTTAGVNAGAAVSDVPLVTVYRGEYPNNVHRGSVAVADAWGNLVFGAGDPTERVFLRSAAKPFQLMPAVLACAVERFDLSDRELAVLCSSHHAEPRHTETVLGILRKAGLDESALHCGVHPPLDTDTAVERWRHGLEPTPVCNNCSGAHTGMLLACLLHGWPLEEYGDPVHPLQQETLAIVSAFAGGSVVELAIDNCDVPTFRMELCRAAQAFARLASGSGVSDALRAASFQIVQAMMANPEMVGGEHSFDTALMRAAHGTVVSKGGADGFAGIGSIPHGLGLAAKVSDGNSRPLPTALLPVLKALDVLDPTALAQLDEYRRPEIRNHRGEVVGHMAAQLTFEGSE